MNKKEAIKLLIGAKKLIKNDDWTNFVCPALNQVCLNDPSISYTTYRKIDEWIQDSLHGYDTVIQWLRVHHIDTYLDVIYKPDGAKQYRLAWIDEMIKQVKNGELK